MAFDQRIADEVALLLETMPLKEICAREGMPDRTTINRWQNERPEFASQCARARALQVDMLVENMADIEAGVLTGEIDPTAARVVLDSQRWRAIKVAPQKYGDKASIEHTGTMRVEAVEWVVLEAKG